MDNYKFQSFLKDIKDKMKVTEIENIAMHVRNPALDEISKNYRNSDTYRMLKSLQDSMVYGSGETYTESEIETSKSLTEPQEAENLMKDIAILFDTRIAVLNDKLDKSEKDGKKQFWIGLGLGAIAGFVFGIGASYISSYLWWLFGPK